MRSPAFETAVALILQHEGGFTLRETDPGNWTGGKVGVGELKGTNLGISAAAYPAEDIRAVTRSRAEELYHRDYWIPIHGDALAPALALITFDMAVNAGVTGAIKVLQRAVNVADDGVLGPVTLARAKTATVDAAIRMTRKRLRYYESLHNWPLEKEGWTQRSLESLVVAATAAAVGSL